MGNVFSENLFTIAGIAADVGFGSRSNFALCFQADHGDLSF